MSAINIDQNNIQSEVMNSDKPVLLDFWAPPRYSFCILSSLSIIC